MLGPQIAKQLRELLARIVHPLELVANLDDSDASRELEQLLAEVSALHEHVRWRHERSAAERAPSFAIARSGEPARVRFAGVPLGHELTSFALALLQVGGVAPKLDAELAAAGRALEGNFELETFVSLECQICPEVVQALNALATLNPGVRHTMVDGARFPLEVAERKILSVPSVFLNGEPFAQGAVSFAAILAKLDSSAAAKSAERLAARAPYDVLVVGGGPAGAAAAIYAARKGVRTGLVADRLGGQLQDTLAIENFVSIERTEGKQLSAALEQHVRSYGVDVIPDQRARALRPGALAELELESGATLRARSVIAATGARWRELGVPGEREYRGRGVAYCPHCDGPLFKGKRVAVIGGGNSGVEAAIDLAGLAAHVTLLEYDSALRADAVLQRRLASLPNVRVVLSAQMSLVEGDGDRVVGLRYRERASGVEQRVALDGVFVQIGLSPSTEWLAGAVALSPRGEIETDARGATSTPGVFAAGDATTVPYKQIVVASGEGAKAALSAFDYLIRSAPEVAATPV